MLSDWQRWAEGRNATEVFEAFMRSIARRQTTAPHLPCVPHPPSASERVRRRQTLPFAHTHGRSRDRRARARSVRLPRPPTPPSPPPAAPRSHARRCICPAAASFVFFRIALEQLSAPSEPIAFAAAQTLSSGATSSSGDQLCCGGPPCRLVTPQSGWCAGATTENACHHARTEGRPCVWVGRWCTKGHAFGSASEPQCPPPPSSGDGGRGGAGGSPLSLSTDRVAHVDPRLAGTRDFVDVRRVLSRLRASVVYLSDDRDGSGRAGGVEREGRSVDSIAGADRNSALLRIFDVPRFARIERRQCLDDMKACAQTMARMMGVEASSVGPRATLPNDAL